MRRWIIVIAVLVAGDLFLVGLPRSTIKGSPPGPASEIHSLLDSKALGFSNTATDEEGRRKAHEACQAYEKARVGAVSKIEADTRTFKLLRTGTNVCSCLAILVSFGISLCGALAGIAISAQPTQAELDKLTDQHRRFRNWILVLSAVSGLIIALGNRLTAYSVDYQQHANQMVALIQKCDADMKGSLNPEEVSDIARRLETELLHI